MGFIQSRVLQQCLLASALVVGGVSLPLTVQAAVPVDFSALVEQVSPAVVRVNVAKKLSQEELLQQQLPELLKRFFGNSIQIPQQRNPVEQYAYGSAFFISSDGYLLTNHHVIEDARKITITLNDRREVDAELVGSDERTDVAVLKVKGSGYPALKLGDSNALKVGEPVLAIGSPFGFDYSASAGIVSAKARTMSAEKAVPFIQSDVALNPGNSGGPLFSQRGEVVGINSRIFSGTGGYMGLSFSIPIDVAMDVFNQIRQNGKVSRAYLGVVPQDIDRNLAEVYGLPRPEGSVLTQIFPDTPASRAGLKEGDIVLAYDGQPINRSTDLINLINRTRPNTKVTLTVLRNGKTLTLTPTLMASAEDEASSASGSSAVPGQVLGLSVRELTPQEQSQLKGKGVLVAQVALDSLAARSGLQQGDVIARLNGQDTPDLASFRQAVASLPTNKVVGVSLYRNGVPVILGLRLESPRP
jgi:serine protease Do